MCLATFPPTEQIENHLEYHLRYGAMKEEEERMGMVRLLHEIVYKGPTDERGMWTGWCVGFLWVDLLAFVSWPFDLCVLAF
jgi:hypothetical protein